MTSRVYVLRSWVNTTHQWTLKEILTCLLLFGGGCLVGQSAPAISSSFQSDPVATRAMENVLVQSGGAAAWQGVSSSMEAFDVSLVGGTGAHRNVLLDDWSTSRVRYRRGTVGQSKSPTEHDGTPTFESGTGSQRTTLPEFDQARVLASRLPAAAAALMLARSEYILQISKAGPCAGGMTCIDVFRRLEPKGTLPPEQHWTLGSNGLPVSVKIAVPQVAAAQRTTWYEVQFEQFNNYEGLVIPIQTNIVRSGQIRQTWRLVSFTPNAPFDTAKFDQEVVR